MADLIVQIMRERDELMSRALSAEARLAEVEAAVKAWVTDQAYRPNDIVLGDQGLTRSQLPDMWRLLDQVLPHWRATFPAARGEGNRG